MSFTPLTDEEYNLKMSIPDVTERFEDSVYPLRDVADDHYSEQEYNGHLAWKRALDQADYLTEKHYEDHISFCVVKCADSYYVLDKYYARKLKLIP